MRVQANKIPGLNFHDQVAKYAVWPEDEARMMKLMEADLFQECYEEV